jgi:hypothetical protein
MRDRVRDFFAYRIQRVACRDQRRVDAVARRVQRGVDFAFARVLDAIAPLS